MKLALPLHFYNAKIKTQRTLIKLVYSSFNLWTQASLSRGPAFVFKVGIDATVRFVASSTIFDIRVYPIRWKISFM